jgi:hypothetical protein
VPDRGRAHDHDHGGHDINHRRFFHHDDCPADCAEHLARHDHDDAPTGDDHDSARQPLRRESPERGQRRGRAQQPRLRGDDDHYVNAAEHYNLDIPTPHDDIDERFFDHIDPANVYVVPDTFHEWLLDDEFDGSYEAWCARATPHG